MAERVYTARDLRVARRWLAADSRQPITERVAALIAAERKRALRGMARWAKQKASLWEAQARGCDANNARQAAGLSRIRKYGILDVAAEASRRARGSK